MARTTAVAATLGSHVQGQSLLFLLPTSKFRFFSIAQRLRSWILSRSHPPHTRAPMPTSDFDRLGLPPLLSMSPSLSFPSQ